MKLPTEKLEEIEYYERKLEQGHNRMGLPWAKDIIVLHFGEYEKQYKLFGLPIWTELIPDRTERLEFERMRNREGEDNYKLVETGAFQSFRLQLEAYFDEESYEVYRELQNHEIDFITS